MKNDKRWLRKLLNLNRLREDSEDFSITPAKTARNITLLYAALGFLWIFFSDWLVDVVITNPEYLTFVNMIKGWVYVFITSLLLFSLISLALGEARQHEQCRQESYEELKKIHGQLALSEQRLRHLAYFDVLTDLPNRLSLQQDLQNVLGQGELLALFFIDLDNFKDVNDFRSHEAGDHLLRMVGKRLIDTVGDKGTVYRFGGDEFIVTAPCLGEPSAQQLARELVISFREPFQYTNALIHLTPSIGLVHSGSERYSSADLIRFADLAMHDSKKRGGNCFTLYHRQLSEGAIDRVLMEQQLRSALEQNRLTLFYQPEVDLASQHISGFEALLRWEPRESINGTVEQVIRVAEATGLIIPMGEWILRKACTFLKQVHDLGHPHTCISVNVSVVQFSRFDFPHRVQKILQEVDLAPSFLRLEITESVLMESYELIDQQIQTLRRLGVKMALDDFGKGYSSLSYLKVLPLDTLKIDKSFIDQIPDSSKDAFLASQIIAIGKNLGLKVVAEGVESAAQLDYLREHHCDRFQGYFYSPPVPAHTALALLEDSNPNQRTNGRSTNGRSLPLG